MTGFGFLVLFGLSCMFPSCEGQITSPPDGTNYTFLPGTTNSITWTFDDDATTTSLNFYFNSSKSSKEELFATISFDNDPQEGPGILPRFNITKPSAKTRTVFLINVDENYDGTYKLVIKKSESEVRVFIAKKPTVTVCSSPLMINEDENGSCLCKSVGGNPPATVAWYDKNDKQIGGKRIGENTLKLTDVDGTDSGSYKCVAESYPEDSYRDDESVQVNVRLNFKPKNTRISFSSPAVVGKSFTISCESEGLPKPAFIIFHNGSEIRKAKIHTIDIVNYTHAGIYKCVAVNKLGNESSASDVLEVVATEPATIPTTKSSAMPSTSTASSGGGVKVKPHDDGKDDGLGVGPIVGIVIGVLALIVIIAGAVYFFCFRSGERAAYMKPDETGRAEKLEDGYRGKRNVSPGGRNDNQLEMGEEGNAYDTVNPAGSGESSRGKGKSKKDNPPPVYAQVDKENRQGKPLYATLDTVALDSAGSKKRDEGRAQPTEYAAIDHGRTADVPRADLV